MDHTRGRANPDRACRLTERNKIYVFLRVPCRGFTDQSDPLLDAFNDWPEGTKQLNCIVLLKPKIKRLTCRSSLARVDFLALQRLSEEDSMDKAEHEEQDQEQKERQNREQKRDRKREQDKENTPPTPPTLQQSAVPGKRSPSGTPGAEKPLSRLSPFGLKQPLSIRIPKPKMDRSTQVRLACCCLEVPVKGSCFTRKAGKVRLGRKVKAKTQGFSTVAK